MPTVKSKEPELEIKAKWSGPEFWKRWDKKSRQSDCHCSSKNGGGALYFVGFVGSLVYFMQAAVGFGAVVTGILKAIVWPAIIIYKLLESFYGVVN